MQLSLYVHFPFCKSKCIYCDFCSFAANEPTMETYCSCLVRETELYALAYADASIQTVYFGGGTPSIVPVPLMQKVLDGLHSCFTIPWEIEFTAEANPGTMTDEWLAVMAEGGVNRLSIGIQAKQERLLKMLGRIHSFPQAAEALRLARDHGIQNLSADLMYGLPTQTLEEYLDSIRAVADLGVQHISAYALKVEDGTRLRRMIDTGTLPAPDEDLSADMMDAGIALLQSLGYRRYEISNFAKPGFRSQHNMKYWQQAYYLGLGLNAASMLPAGDTTYVRQTNTLVMDTYCQKLLSGRLPVEECIPISRREAMFETVMLGLRTTDGVRFKNFEAMHKTPLFAVYGDAIRTLQNRGWLQPMNPEDPRLVLNEKGMAMQNTALMPFMDEK